MDDATERTAGESGAVLEEDESGRTLNNREIWAGGSRIACCRTEAVAAALTRAVNNHAPLLAILREMIESAGNPDTELLIRAERVLADAESGTP